MKNNTSEPSRYSVVSAGFPSEHELGALLHIEGMRELNFPRLAGHKKSWLDSLEHGLGYSTYVLQSMDGQGQLAGLLPLCLVSSVYFGRFLVSLPYLNTGGVWARSPDVARSLVDQAVELADRLQVKHLELRHEIPLEHPKLTVARTDKVHMRLALPDTPEALMKFYKSKLRSQIKKVSESPFELVYGSVELLPEFYSVFATNMRDLGTPVYSPRLFQSILQQFGPESSELAVVRLSGQAIAGALLIHTSGVSEVPSASSLRAFNNTGANLWMYSRLLDRAILKGSKVFDFGRSSLESGTFKFKEQWGAKPFPAVWQYYVRSGDPSDMRPDSQGKQRLIKAWQKLPVWLTRLIGPSIVRGIP